MATKEQKKAYVERVKPYKNKVEELKKEANTARTKSKKRDLMAPYYTVKFAQTGMKIANTQVMMSGISQVIQRFKNEGVLNDARKQLATILSDLTALVGEHLDGQLTENKEVLEKLSYMKPVHKVHLLMELKNAIEAVKEAMGPHSKWRWYFPDFHLKLITIARNLFDFKEFDRVRKNPGHELYDDYQTHLQFLMDESHETAQFYRSKYELSTNEVSDLQVIEKIFEMLRRIYSYTGNKTEAAKIKTSLDTLTAKIESIMADRENKGKKKKD